jgi:hypothetical protein
VDHVIKPIKCMSKRFVSFHIPIKPVPIGLVKMVIPLDTFQQRLLKTFF